MSKYRKCLPLLLLAALAGCAPQIDREAEQASLLLVDQEWAALASEGTDVDRIVSYWSDDVTIFPPDAPAIQGKEAIRQFMVSVLEIPGFHVTWQPTTVFVAPGGDFGYTTGTNAMTAPDADGNLVTTPGRYVTVWRKEAGVWKCVIDIWNAGAPEEAEETS
jgi:ketosteroid isomerase-like protein